ncbi:MAG: FxsA family protein [Gemmatimonadetes bacterium]|nr:FxsA family protein [Gemmatimonadota bacterium]
MSCLARLAFFFIVIPAVELLLLLRIGQAVGFVPTLALVLATGFVGAALARAEGLRVLVHFQRELAGGHMPGQALMDGISVLVGGALLLTPGVLTDVAGIALLLPPSRRWIQRRVRARLEAGLRSGSVRFVVLDPSGVGGPFQRPGQGAWGDRQAPEPDLDPRHEIRIDTPPR